MLALPKSSITILSLNEQQQISNMFPDKLKPFLANCNNPLDETQILINLFKDKDVRIYICQENDEFGDLDYLSYYHAVDMAKQIGFDEKNINNWNRLWNIQFIKFKNLPLNNLGVKFSNMLNDKRTKIDANFISEQELKKVLLKINTPEAKIFQEWILRQSTITKKIFKHVIEIKHKLELDKEKHLNKLEIEKHKLEIEKKDTMYNQLQHELDTTHTKLLKITKEAVNLYSKPDRKEGIIYIATSPDKIKKKEYKIGYYTTNKGKRESTMKTTDPSFKILKEYNSKDVQLTESFIHKYMDHLRVYKDKEFFYMSNIEVYAEMIDKITIFINKLIETYDDDYTILQDQYIKERMINPVKLIEDTKIKLIENTKKDTTAALTTTTKDTSNIYKQYLDERTEKSDKHIHTSTLYEDFKNWYVINNLKNKIPSNREFIKELRKYVIVEDKVKVNILNTTGIKNFKIKS